ncbi:hypothetical protein [Brucella intermedia]|uniref:hypothetical protein n=1 Tax=Brucella intermedia TaxID=94625 RepID=UPI00124CAC7E|nr:hypothetical protein [Brucella intermedia]KAB2708314.1 hypothetical protein F9K80_14555 [Brucella intermedia]
MSRWVRVQTSIFDHELFQAEPLTEREAWLWLIANAAWKATRHRIGTDMHEVPAGSLFVTLRQLQTAWKWKSDYRVRSFLKLLEKEEMIVCETNAGKTQVTICNYSHYQEAERTENASATQEKRTKDTNTPNTSSLRSDVKAQAPAKAKRGSRLPDDFKADISEASRLGLSEADATREADKFRDYWNSQPGQRGVKLDWQATWRNWCRSAVERKPHRKEPPPKPSTPRNAGEAAYLELQRNGTDDISPEFKQLLFGGDASRDRCEPNTAEIIALESKRYGGF